MKFRCVVLWLIFPALAPACDLCAIYNATSARGESSSGFLFTVSEQFISYGKLQNEGESVHLTSSALQSFFERAYHDSSITHLVPGYNFSSRLGVNLNIPIIYRSFRRTQLTPLGELVEETGSEFGLGDMSLIGRWTLIQKVEMNYSLVFNFLGGVKFPTGDNQRLPDEVEQERFFTSFFGAPGHYHPIGGVHQHDLTLGSGSYDGVFGTSANLRWNRWFFGNQIQYYLRTEADGYEFGDELIVSGGPGAYVLLNETFTLSLQANAVYDTMARDKVLDVRSTETGWTAWYFGPQLTLTWGGHFSANAGVDIPLRIYNRGVQNVPDYRIHAGVTWRF
jgi:hypothetical protein